jgi:predicted nucleic acid-binding protein
MTGPVTADTSLVVPALADWHEAHSLAREAIEPVRRLPAHVLVECLAVLTRLPHGLAVPAGVAADVLRRAFPGQPLTLPSSDYDRLFTAAAEARLRGGQLYDALVGATAAYAGARLLTLDQRAQSAYAAVGVEFVTVA